MAFKDPEARRRYQAEWKRAKRAADRETDRKYQRDYYAADPSRFAETRQAYRETHREELAEAQRKRNESLNRRAEVLRRHGLTVEQYQQMLDAQDGRCAICRVQAVRPLPVDHCHSTGAVRGLLCDNCNKGLGMFADSPDRLRAALAYLERTTMLTTGNSL